MSRCEHCGDDHCGGVACRPLDSLAAYRETVAIADRLRVRVAELEAQGKTLAVVNDDLHQHLDNWQRMAFDHQERIGRLEAALQLARKSLSERTEAEALDAIDAALAPAAEEPTMIDYDTLPEARICRDCGWVDGPVEARGGNFFMKAGTRFEFVAHSSHPPKESTDAG